MRRGWVLAVLFDFPVLLSRTDRVRWRRLVEVVEVGHYSSTWGTSWKDLEIVGGI
jgi:hypothetical protein